MAAVALLVRDWTFEINIGGGDVEIKGLSTMRVSSGDTKASTTVKEDAGMETHLVGTRTKTISLSGKWLEDSATGARDAGQEAVETLAAGVGADSIGTLTITTPGGTATSMSVSATMGDTLGDEAQAADWAVTFERSGAET